MFIEEIPGKYTFDLSHTGWYQKVFKIRKRTGAQVTNFTGTTFFDLPFTIILIGWIRCK